MSYLIKGILGAAAVSLTLGAVQFASGHDLAASLEGLSAAPGNSVNRADKADRAAVLAASVLTTRTIAFRPAGIAATSVLVRIPATVTAREIKRTPPIKSTQQKPMVACEPVVSVLTDVAKRLQPGRCVA
ncbi:MAG: hypothetical protein ACM3OF_05310 [Gemmatimonas sp.]|jgi:hypothetical protein